MKRPARMAQTTLLLAAFLLATAAPAAAQRASACPRIPSVSSDPLNRSYRAGDLVPAELLDPPFVWIDCAAPSLPAGASRNGQARVVFLSVTVDETGAVIDARPRGAIDPEGFYDAAVAAIRSWRTNRPMWRSVPVKASIAVDVRFSRSEPPAAEPPVAQASTAPAPVAGQGPTATQAASAPTVQPESPAPSVATPPVSTPPPAEATRPEPPPATPAPTRVVTPTQMPAPAPSAAPPAAAAPAPRPAAASDPVVVEPPPARSEPPRAPQMTQPSQARASEPFVVEYYYKVRWGFADEFWLLFNRNHWPLLQKQMEMGRILEVRAERPRYHATEDGRWDYRVTIVFRSAAEANATFDTEALERTLFPDLAGYRREEKRRFELLLAHWDVPILPATLEP